MLIALILVHFFACIAQKLAPAGKKSHRYICRICRFLHLCHHACTMSGKACPRSGMSDIIARILYLIFSHYLANIVYRDLNGISRCLYDIWICPDVWVFSSVLDNRLLSEIWVICQKCQFRRAEKTFTSIQILLQASMQSDKYTRFFAKQTMWWLCAFCRKTRHHAACWIFAPFRIVKK